MPELPEVETIVRALRQGGRNGPALMGRTVTSANLLWQRSLMEPSPEEFIARLAGQKIVDITRRGKFIWFNLGQDQLFIHLRMSGDLRVETGGLTPQTHDRALFFFNDDFQMAFNDPRKFGRIWLTRDPQTVIGDLGPEPLDPSFTPDIFYNRLHSKNRQLKPLLLDQRFLAGLGNIYSDESLHLAGLHPTRLSADLSQQETQRLWSAIRQILQEGIAHDGSSIDWVYRGGNHQNAFRVYQRTGEPCPVCGQPIQRRLIGQRGTHYCPVCQPE
jgi:formamidopyrimidine-DNA glycosylase